MQNTLYSQSLQDKQRIYVYTVGGCGEFGMNMTLYLYAGHCLMVDCGLNFAEAYEIGIDAHIPDAAELEAVLGCRPHAYLITHGHEDHLGALPYFLKKWPAPVYLGPWAHALLKDKLAQLRDSEPYEIHEINSKRPYSSGPFSIRWHPVAHSIPHCSALIIEAGKGLKILHTGDFKLKGFGPWEADTDLQSLAEEAKKSPFLALVIDSTNAQSPGLCPSEEIVLPEITRVFAEAKGISFVTTFSSNLWRLKTVMMAAKSLQKRVLPFGAGIRKCLDIAAKLKLLGDEVSALIDEEGADRIDRKDFVVLCSGCQGEYRSGLKRIVSDEVRHLQVEKDDQVIFSSRVIPGNEKAIAKIASICHQKEAKVITAKERPNIHVSGHAYAGDISALMDALQAHFHIPVHGTHTQLLANQKLASHSDRVVKTENGICVGLGKENYLAHGYYPLQKQFIDSWSRLPMSYDSMRARHKIGDSGLALITGFIGANKKLALEFEFIGLPFGEDHDEEHSAHLFEKHAQILYQRQLQSGLDLSRLAEELRMHVRRQLTDRFVKKPAVICKIYGWTP